MSKQSKRELKGYAAGCYVYEPKPIPITDSEGNVIGYEYPPVIPCPLVDSEDKRVKSFPNELGCTADRDNVAGFSAAVDVINAHRNTKTSGLSPVGQDDCGMMAEISSTINTLSKKK